MTGTVEVDETYIDGKRKGKWDRDAVGKTAIIGALKQGGNVLPVVVERTDAETVEAVIDLATDKSAQINTDEYGAYNGLQKLGYAHDTVNHGSEQWTKGRCPHAKHRRVLESNETVYRWHAPPCEEGSVVLKQVLFLLVGRRAPLPPSATATGPVALQTDADRSAPA